ncbi:uncharacterized protein BDR25DRAFT_164004, partial [Lindgomyces ingoldianus]
TAFGASTLAILGYIIFAFNTVFLGWLSEKLNEHSLVAPLSQARILPLLTVLVSILENASPWVRYIMFADMNGILCAHSIPIGTASKDSKPVGARSVSAAVYTTYYQVGSIIAANDYREGTSCTGNYTSNRALVGLCSANIALSIGIKILYTWGDKAKARALRDLPKGER